MPLLLAESSAGPIDPRPANSPPNLPSHVAACDAEGGLSAILRPEVNLAVWSRTPAVQLPGEAALASIDDVSATLPVDGIAHTLPMMLAQAGYSDASGATIAADIARLGRVVGRIAECTSVDIRLEVVETDACRKFHADYVRVRLICTYVGPGTQWLADADAALLHAGADPADLPIRTLATGDVALFKGRLWSDDGAIVHRSPPIAGTGARRLVLVIDPAREDQAAFDRA